MDKDILNDEIRKINDFDFEYFEQFPKSIDEAAERWSNAIFKHCEDVVPPSITLQQAKQICYLEFLKVSNNPKQFEIAIMKFAEVMKDGMIGFNGVMPPTDLNLITVFLKGFSGSSSLDIANELSEKIHAWFKTGTAINVSSGITINWN